jgi:Pyruvate/2-oxoacid:ferredoxin oxidoreductase gamma subunit
MTTTQTDRDEAMKLIGYVKIEEIAALIAENRELKAKIIVVESNMAATEKAYQQAISEERLTTN